MALDKAQIKQLRTFAHKLKPVIWIGQNGLSESIFDEIETALTHHELIKLKLRTGDREEHDTIVQTICRQTGAEPVQRIGNIVTLYRPNPDKPRIKLAKT